MADKQTTQPATTKPPQYINLALAVEISGLSEQEILDMAALGNITAGLIVPLWKGYAIPIKGGLPYIGVSDGEYVGNEFVPTKYAVTPRSSPSHVVKVFSVRDYWSIGGAMAELARTNTPCELHFLWPYEGVDLSKIKHLMPWEESMIKLEKGQTITRDDLRFVRSEVESLFEQERGLGQPQPSAETDTTETTPTEGRPWAHLIDSPNPNTGSLYKQDATRIRKSLTPEERRTWAREALARNGGNNTAAGRELAVTESCIRWYLMPKK